MLFKPTRHLYTFLEFEKNQKTPDNNYEVQSTVHLGHPNTGMGAALQPNSHATVSVFFCFKLQVFQPSSLVNGDFSSEASFFIYNY